MLRPITRSALFALASAALLHPMGCFQGRPYSLDQHGPGNTDQDSGCVPSECAGTCCGDVCVEDFNTNPGHCGGCDHPCTRYELCVNGECTCTIDCEQKVCGDDGCGGSCGSCPSDQVCSWREDAASCIDEDIGCSDGSREGFVDMGAFSDIASCAATWDVQSLRAPASGVACGNDLDLACDAPRDACSWGWHICMANGFLEDLRARTSGDDCASAVAGDGAFAVASDYDDGEGDCVDTPFECSEYRDALCCGSGCQASVTSCVWPELSSGSRTDSVCRSVTDADGVVCCRDPELEN